MKKIIYLAILLLMVATAQAQTEKETKVIEKPQKVVIVTTDSSQTIEVTGRKKEPNYKYKKTINVSSNAESKEVENKSWNYASIFGGKKNEQGYTLYILGKFYLGYNYALGTPDNMKVHNIGSLEYGFDVLGINKRFGSNSLYSAVGVGGKSFNMKDDYIFKKSSNKVIIGSEPANLDYKHSRINIETIFVPLTYTYYAKKDFSFSVSSILNYNFSGEINNTYKINDKSSDNNGEKVNEIWNKIHVVPFTVDFRAQINISHFGFYTKYSPCNVLKSSYAPEFSAISFGIILF
jgi:hypothetical protein